MEARARLGMALVIRENAHAHERSRMKRAVAHALAARANHVRDTFQARMNARSYY